MPSRRLLAGVLVALLVALAWQIGERRGAERAEARAAAASAAADPSSDAPVTAAGDDPGADELAALVGERDMLRETVRTLRVELERADRLSASERAELELYRRIGADETAAGLAIDTLERGDGVPATLHLTLVQARGRDRVTGRVEIVTLGPRAAELPEGETTRELRAALADDDSVPFASAPFDLRFFQTLELPLGASFPETVEVRILPDSAAHPPFRKRFRRDDIPLRG